MFSNPSLGRDLPPYHNFDPSRMGFGSSNQPMGSSGFGQMGLGSNRVGNFGGFMDLNSATSMGQQRSHNMFSGPSPQNLQPTFMAGGRGPAPLHQPTRESDQVSTILASFGLSSSDLDELSRLPEDKITADNLPEIIQHLKRKRSDNMDMLSNRDRLSSVRPSSDNWNDPRQLRASFEDRPSGLNPVADFGHAGSSLELSNRGRLEIDMLKERERLRDDRFLSEPPFRNPENRPGYSSLQERPMGDKPRGMPSARNIDDFRGVPPKAFPHLCSLCDIPVNSFQSWDEHVSGLLHKKQSLLLLELYPQWKGQGMGTDAYMQQQSSPGVMGPPPPPSMGGPNVHHGNFRGATGMEGMQEMQRPNQQEPGRVVHVVDIERTKNLKPQLMKLVESFGTVTNSLILNGTKEAFVEMSTPAEANAVVNFYKKNKPLVHGMPVRMLLSQKYKQIRNKGFDRFQQNVQDKFDPKPGSQFPGPEQQAIDCPGRVLRVCNLPKSEYPDDEIIKLALPFGIIKNFIIMRKMRQAFIEMEKAEDAEKMIESCNKNPLNLKGSVLHVVPSRKYNTLVLKMPNNELGNRKRTRSSDDKTGGKKQNSVFTEGDTTNMGLVKDSDRDLREDDDVDPFMFKRCASDEAKVPDIGNKTRLSQSEALEPLSSTPVPAGDKKAATAFRKKMEGFGTLGNDGQGVKKKKMEGKRGNVESNKKSKKGATEKNALPQTDYDLGPYQPNVPTGVEYVISKTGYYCRLCSLFYTNEEMAKVTHCCSLAHYKKLKNILNKPSNS